MEARHYATCLWPGLPEIWWRGRLSALPTAIAFGFALNLLLITRYIYPGWVAGGLVTMASWVGVAAWLFCVIRSVREVPALIAPRQVSESPDHFPEAQTAYLRGQWAEAEGLLTDLLAIEPRDPPALLLLAGVYRHTDRLEASHALLQEIVKVEIADTWWLEVESEALRLKRAIEASKKPAEKQDGSDQEPTQSAADLTASAAKAA